jgi:hypothetical protein
VRPTRRAIGSITACAATMLIVFAGLVLGVLVGLLRLDGMESGEGRADLMRSDHIRQTVAARRASPACALARV